MINKFKDWLPILGRRHESRADNNIQDGYGASDEQGNSESTPPIDETIDLYCAWAVEIYTPTHMQSLGEHLRKFDEESESLRASQRDLASWLEGSQRNPYGQSMASMGYWAPKSGTQSRVFATHRVHLPDAVEYATGTMYSISSTVTCIVVCFVFAENVAARFEEALRQERSTFLTPTARGSEIHFPMTQKSDDIGRIRCEISQLGATWFRNNFPGAFSEGAVDGGIPMCEFMAFQKAKPYSPQDDAPAEMYVNLLGLQHDRDTWQHSGFSGLKFGFHRPSRNAPRYHATLAVNAKDWSDANPNGDGLTAKSRLLSYVRYGIPELMSVWAITPLLQGYTDQLGQVEKSAEFRIGESNDALRVLRRLTDQISRLSDISAVSADLVQRTEQRSRPRIFDAPFVRNRSDERANEGTLDRALWNSIRERASWLRVTDGNIRDRLSQFGATVSATENVRLQRKVSHLTRVVVLLTLAALFAPALHPSLVKWTTTLGDQAKDWVFGMIGRLF